MDNEKQRTKIRSTISIIATIAIILGFHTFLYQPYTIPSGSMTPTLLVGDFLFVNKYAYSYSRYSTFLQPKFISGHVTMGSPKRGDIAVFFHDFSREDEAQHYDHGMFGGFFSRQWRNIRGAIGCPMEGVHYVKRVIGLPGDKIQMKAGRLYINGKQIPLEFVDTYPLNESHMPPIARRYVETLPNGVKHYVLKAYPFGEAHLDNTPEFTVPPGHYFMMGDHRDNSLDSREIKGVGFVPEHKFVGAPAFLFFSTEASWLQVHKWLFSVRWKRLFKAYTDKLRSPLTPNV
ncbi:MAG: signal peptidase I [Holosporales bacterium]|jgi:signal peptidase I|nr:signal peptidase I [Holosporales bacterium]